MTLRTIKSNAYVIGSVSYDPTKNQTIGTVRIRVLTPTGHMEGEEDLPPNPFYDTVVNIDQIYYRPGTKVYRNDDIMGHLDVIGHAYINKEDDEVYYFLQVSDKCVSHREIVISEPPPPHINPLSVYEATDTMYRPTIRENGEGSY